MPFETIMTASQVCTAWATEIRWNEKILSKIVYKTNEFKAFGRNFFLGQRYVNLSIPRIPNALKIESTFAENRLILKSLTLVVDVKFARMKAVCDYLPNLEELEVSQRRRNRDSFPHDEDHATLNTTKPKVFVVRAKSLKFAAGSLGVVS